MFCFHGLGISHAVIDGIMALPFLIAPLYYIKAKLKTRANYPKLSHDELFFDGPIKQCNIETNHHNFFVAITRNGFRVKKDNPCVCKKYSTQWEYIQEVDKDI